jgi:uncharacterized protein YigE (DUF2233 family)
MLAGLAGLSSTKADQEICQPLTYEDARYTVCTVDVGRMDVGLFSIAAEGTPYGSFAALAERLEQQGRQWFRECRDGDGTASSDLYRNGSGRRPIRDGYGNFHLKPNGAFYIANA